MPADVTISARKTHQNALGYISPLTSHLVSSSNGSCGPSKRRIKTAPQSGLPLFFHRYFLSLGNRASGHNSMAHFIFLPNSVDGNPWPSQTPFHADGLENLWPFCVGTGTESEPPPVVFQANHDSTGVYPYVVPSHHVVLTSYSWETN
jgi:hypothetical protein